MDVLSLCPLPVAPLIWEIQPSRWVLTVVCKATFRLEPGVLSLADDQEPIFEQDHHWDEDAARSLYAPSDLVPFKPRADVLLVGTACAKNGQPVRSLIVRLAVGKVDKSIEVVSPRLRTREGEIREGKRWMKMPITYERAAGGPGTDNPVGMGPGSPRDPYGQLPLPCLVPPGFNTDTDRAPPPLAFGPVAPSWPLRRSKLGKTAPDRDVTLAPFGEGFDAGYFQSAPSDQQTDTIRPNERITLENLHPKHAILMTSLPGVAPRARVELSGPAREVSLSGDTLWIDTDAGICTVTYRAKVDLERPDQEGRVLVALAKGTEPVPWAKLAPAPSAPAVVTVPSAPIPSAPIPSAPVSAPPRKEAPTPPSSSPVPPAVAAPRKEPVAVPAAPPSAPSSPPTPGLVVPPPRPSASPPAIVVPPLTTQAAPPASSGFAPPSPLTPPLTAGPMRPPSVRPPDPPLPISASPIVEEELSDVDIEITVTEGHAKALDKTGPVRPITRPIPSGTGENPGLPFHALPPGWQSSPAPRPSAPALVSPPESLTALGAGAPRTPPPPLDWFDHGTAQDASFTAEVPAVAPPPLLTSTAPWAPLPAPPPLIAPPPGDSFSLLDASNAAAQVAKAPQRTGSEPELKAQDARPQAPLVEAVLVELVWHEPLFLPLLSYLPKPPKEAQSKEPEPSSGEENKAKEAGESAEAALAEALRARFYDALSRGAPISVSAVEAALDASEEESPPKPAVVLVTGTLDMCLDEVEMLKALVVAATPLGASDKKLKEVLDVATEMLKSPMLAMPDFAQGLGARIREAWSKANRALPQDHLSASTERLLLEQRAYQKRDLLDDTHLRGLLSTPGASLEIPVYLPARVSKRLPLFKRFPVRLVAEVVWQQDQYETCPVALRALALGRLPVRARGRTGSRSRS